MGITRQLDNIICRYYIQFKPWYDHLMQELVKDAEQLTYEMINATSDVLLDKIAHLIETVGTTYGDCTSVFMVSKTHDITLLYHSIYWYAFYCNNIEVIKLILNSGSSYPYSFTIKTIYNKIDSKGLIKSQYKYIFPFGIKFTPLYAICKLTPCDLFLDIFSKYINVYISGIRFCSQIHNEYTQSRYSTDILRNTIVKNQSFDNMEIDFGKSMIYKLFYTMIDADCIEKIECMSTNKAKSIFGNYYKDFLYTDISEVTNDLALISYIKVTNEPVLYIKVTHELVSYILENSTYHVYNYLNEKCKEYNKEGLSSFVISTAYYNNCSCNNKVLYNIIGGDNVDLLESVLQHDINAQKDIKTYYMCYLNHSLQLSLRFDTQHNECFRFLVSQQYLPILKKHKNKNASLPSNGNIISLTSFSKCDIINGIIRMLVFFSHEDYLTYLPLFLDTENIKYINVLDPVFYKSLNAFPAYTEHTLSHAVRNYSDHKHAHSIAKFQAYSFLYFIHNGMSENILIEALKSVTSKNVDHMLNSIIYAYILAYKVLPIKKIYMYTPKPSHYSYDRLTIPSEYIPSHKKAADYVHDYKPYDIFDVNVDILPCINYNIIGYRFPQNNFNINFDISNIIDKYILLATVKNIYKYIHKYAISSINTLDLSCYPWLYTHDVKSYFESYNKIRKINFIRILNLPLTSGVGSYLDLFNYIHKNSNNLEVLYISVDWNDYDLFGYIFNLINTCSNLHTLYLEINNNRQQDINRGKYTDISTQTQFSTIIDDNNLGIHNTNIKNLTLNIVQNEKINGENRLSCFDYAISGIISAFKSLETLDVRRNNISNGLSVICAPFNESKLTKLKYVYVKYYSLEEDLLYIHSYLNRFYEGLSETQPLESMVLRNRFIDNTQKDIIEYLVILYKKYAQDNDLRDKTIKDRPSTYNFVTDALCFYNLKLYGPAINIIEI